MHNTLTIARRELRSYLTSPWSYLVAGVFLLVTGYGFGWSRVTYQESSIQGFLDWGGFFLIFMAPAMTGRLLAEEEKLGTLELLMTSPVRDVDIVLGKYLGAVGMFGGMLLMTMYYPLLLAWFGTPDWGPVVSGYVGIFLLGALLLAVGLFASSLTSNQVTAFVVGSALVLASWFAASPAFLLAEPAAGVLRGLSIATYYPAFGRGVLDTAAVVYYLSLAAVFLFLAVRSLESRRWR